MFSIYEYDGRVFRDTLEELYKVYPVGGTSASRGIELLKDTAPDPTQTSYIPNSSALEAYRSLIHASPKEELHHAYEIMQKADTVLEEGATIYSALNSLNACGLDTIPIVNNEQRIVGLFSYKKVINELVLVDAEEINLKITTLKFLQNEKVITAEPVTSIRRIADVMFRFDLAIMPIIDSFQNLVGIVTLKDIAGAIANEPPLSVWS
ncbi:CBS domain-containing protein [Neptuniibacter sp.]|uniref:CBS domain-containing protein n=1 Tax=Neptuniibacter sp. TaxID=1962643 RepID=UPI0026273300|nr:CBS domain-containing protein [Neptuniibacter sp.]MCP4595098.1 CBS domain-containing protein [Neptuniibacter sp.]